jgi:AraC-like DNA-binding protein
VFENNYPKSYLYKRIVEAKLFIDDNFSQPIDLDKISNTAHFSKYHFLRLFKKTYGKTPHQYLTHLRLQEAKNLLSKGESITSVCYGLSFSSLSSFAKLFKKNIGITPTQYVSDTRKHLKSLKEAPINHIPVCFAEYLGFKK